MQASKVIGVCHVKQAGTAYCVLCGAWFEWPGPHPCRRDRLCRGGFLIALALQLMAACGNTVCVDSEFGDWAFVRGQWLHCDSWVAACSMNRAADDCVSEARDAGCQHL